MPIKLSEIRNKTRTVTVEYDGERIAVAYRPAALTADMEQKIYSAVPGQYMSTTAVVVADLVSAWEVTDDEGAPLPATAEIAKLMPLPFLEAVLKAVMDDGHPPKA